MAHATSVSLGGHFQDFATHLVAEGRYATVSEAVRAGLRLLEEHEDRVRALRQALIDGENSGAVRPFDNAGFKSDAVAAALTGNVTLQDHTCTEVCGTLI